MDAVDDLNPAGANALLKILEEPPRRAVLLLVSHSAARVLPTIRSRRRLLALRPLQASELARAAAAAIEEGAETADIEAAAAVADGSVQRALALLDGDALDLRSRITALLERLPAVDPRALHALGDRLYGTDPATLAAFVDTVNTWLSTRWRANWIPRGSRGWPRCGSGSTSPRATWMSSISSASHWFSVSSAGLPRRRAVDT